MNDLKKILFVQLGTLGDMILATPAFSLIKKQYPNAELHVLSGRRGKDVLKFDPNVDKVIVNDKSPVKLLKNMFSLRSANYDLYIDPKDHFSREGTMFAKITSAKKKIGFNSDKPVFDISVRSEEENTALHYTDRVMHALSLTGINIPGRTPRPELYIDPEISIDKSGYYLINISAGKESRIWYKENWVEFLSWIDTQEKKFLLINMPSEDEIAEHIVSNCPFVKRYRTNSIHYVFALVKNSIGVITPDTAIIHIASAYNIPIIAMIGGDELNNTKFASLSDKAIIVKTETTDNDIKDISPQKMIEAWKQFV